jgi:alcohol dehydrogenase (NADP+)
MRFLQFSNGDKMPILGLGTWKSEAGKIYTVIKEAIRLGYRHIDCAPIYGNEAEIGQALSDSFKEGVVSRDQLWITSKLWNDAHAPADVEPALQKTLSDLQLSYLDLYLIHWPVVFRKGVSMPESAQDMLSLDALPISKTWQALEAVMEKGLCRHIGVSNFSIAKLKTLLGQARLKPAMNQIELHPYLQQPEMVDFCRENRIPLTAYSPLGSLDRPVLLKTADEPILLEDPTITAIASRHRITPAQVLISWAIGRGTAAIPKSVDPARMKQNLDAVALTLTQEDMLRIAALDRNRRYVSGEIWAMKGGPYTTATIWDE